MHGRLKISHGFYTEKASKFGLWPLAEISLYDQAYDQSPIDSPPFTVENN